jgi:alkylation response protein AidB-like acyl-CoA dehydrogenase
MTFTAKPLFPGDAFDVAARFAEMADRRLAAATDPSDRARTRKILWGETVSLGWSITLVPEDFDGAGGNLLDLAAIIEGCGRFALPLPALAAFGVAPLLVATLIGKRKEQLFRDIAASKILLFPLLEPCTGFGGTDSTLSAKSRGNDLVIDGKALGVQVVPDATHYLIACPTEHAAAPRPALLLVPSATSGIAVQDRVRMDGRASADLYFSGVAVEAQNLLASGAAVTASIEKVHDTAALLVCVEAVAAMGALLEQTISYLTDRTQFDVPLSSFQVLRHYVADMYVAYENLRALTNHTLRLAAAEPDRPWSEVALVKLRLTDVSRLLAHTAIQVHGGMGVTEELPATRLAKRILMSDFEYGTGDFHAQRLLDERAGRQTQSYA